MILAVLHNTTSSVGFIRFGTCADSTRPAYWIASYDRQCAASSAQCISLRNRSTLQKQQEDYYYYFLLHGKFTVLEPATKDFATVLPPWPCIAATMSITCLTHDAVRAVGGSRAGGGAVVIRSAPRPTCSVEAGHWRKAADVCRRVWGVALQRQGHDKHSQSAFIRQLLRTHIRLKDWRRTKRLAATHLLPIIKVSFIVSNPFGSPTDFAAVCCL